MKEVVQKILNKLLIKIVFLVLIGFSLYLNTLNNPLFWDDYDGILHNLYIQNWAYWPKFFTENLIAGAGFLSDYWRPMILIVFSTAWHLWQDNPLGYHLVNIVLHISNAILLFFILKKILKKDNLAFLIALIFLIHPVQTEAIAYVSGIGDPLSVLFIFLSTTFFIKFLEKIKAKFLIFSTIFFVFALMSKETAIITPFILFLIGLFYFDKQPFKKKIQKILIYLMPLIIIAVIYFGLRLTVLNFKNTLNLYNEENLFTKRLDIRILTFFKTLPFYFNFMFLPLDLHMERQIEIPKSIFDPLVLLGIFIISILVFLLVEYFDKDYVFSFGIIWFFISIFPVSNILIPVSGLLYEHWLYLPLIGIFLSLLWMFTKLLEKYGLEKIGLIILIVFLTFLGLRTIMRNFDWRDPVAFYQQIIQHNPKSYRIWNNLGIEAEKQGKIELAKKAYEQATILDPTNPVAFHNLGVVFLRENNFESAESYFKTAIEKDKKFFYSYLLLAKLYWDNKQLDKAKEVLKKYLTIGERADVYFVLSQLYKEEKKLDESIKYLSEALRLDPKNALYRQEMELLQKAKI
jgi:Tfp pilus assembly protein PilF